jgi:uncharacterized protein (DUF433 family)
MKVDYKAIQEDPALRRGVYGLGELTNYLSFGHDRSLSASTVARWAKLTSAMPEHRPRRPDYSFADLVSLLVVRNLVWLGLRPHSIRDAEEHLRARYGHEHPFLSVRLKTDGVDVFYDALPSFGDQLTAANLGGQEVLRPAITRALKGVAYERGMATAWSPANGVVLDPTIQFGAPCIAETGITTSQMAALTHFQDVGPKELAQTYRLEEQDVRRALNFERKLSLA